MVVLLPGFAISSGGGWMASGDGLLLNLARLPPAQHKHI